MGKIILIQHVFGSHQRFLVYPLSICYYVGILWLENSCLIFEDWGMQGLSWQAKCPAAAIDNNWYFHLTTGSRIWILRLVHLNWTLRLRKSIHLTTYAWLKSHCLPFEANIHSQITARNTIKCCFCLKIRIFPSLDERKWLQYKVSTEPTVLGTLI